MLDWALCQGLWWVGHRAWFCDLDIPLAQWRTQCGWKFSHHAPHSLPFAFPKSASRCGRCFAGCIGAGGWVASE
eukprot:6053900-Amphidinium_carterae.1